MGSGWLLLEKRIQDFDGRALTIKTWSVSFSMVALVAAFALCLFWYIECMWKTFQYVFYERINQIEDFFAGKGEAPAPLQIGRPWYNRFVDSRSNSPWRYGVGRREGGI